MRSSMERGFGTGNAGEAQGLLPAMMRFAALASSNSFLMKALCADVSLMYCFFTGYPKVRMAMGSTLAGSLKSPWERDSMGAC